MDFPKNEYPGLTFAGGKPFLLLYHGTNSDSVGDVVRSGRLRSPYLTSSMELAEYYAEVSMEEAESDDYDILAVLVPLELAERHLKADMAAHSEPISYGYPEGFDSESDFHDALDSGDLSWPSENDFATSLFNTQSVRMDCDLKAECLTSITDLDIDATDPEDLLVLLQIAEACDSIPEPKAKELAPAV